MRKITLGKLCALGILATAVLFGASPAWADDAYTFTGSNERGFLWNRPIGSGPSVSTNVVRGFATFFTLTQDSDCRISSAQDYDGYLHLYGGIPNLNTPIVNLIAGDDDGPMGVGDSLLEVSLTSGFYTLITSGFANTSVGFFHNRVHCTNSATRIIHGFCNFFPDVPLENQACLNNFAVKVDNVSNSNFGGLGAPVPMGSADSAVFWFFGETNFEALVKVLNGCGINNRFWVFLSAVTNQRYRVSVRDLDGTVKTYTNPLGNRAQAVADTQAFASCDGALTSELLFE